MCGETLCFRLDRLARGVDADAGWYLHLVRHFEGTMLSVSGGTYAGVLACARPWHRERLENLWRVHATRADVLAQARNPNAQVCLTTGVGRGGPGVARAASKPSYLEG